MNIKTKEGIRKYIIQKRDLIAIEVKKKWDDEIFSRVINNPFYKKAKTIFIFTSFGSEVDTHKLIDYGIKDGKIIGVPKVIKEKRKIEFFKIRGFEDLKLGYYGILEPIETCEVLSSEEVDLILMPGLAFDKKGGRVGYGGGFYDRYLGAMERKVPKIAIAYDFQIIDNIPMNSLDIKIDGIITNEKVIEIKGHE